MKCLSFIGLERNMSQSTLFVTILLCNTQLEAHIIKGRLEAEGLVVTIADENFLAMDPFLAQGSNGFRVQVSQEDEARARQILKEIDLGHFAIDDSDEAI
jgi:hypothetical protein